MRVLVATDITIQIVNGSLFAQTKYSTILRRYFESFGKIVLCSRIENSTTDVSMLEDITPIIDDIVTIDSLSKAIVGRYNKKLNEVLSSCDLVVSRCPGVLAFACAKLAMKVNKPVFAEVMGCAWDAYWNHGVKGKLLAPYMFFTMKNVVKKANFALYVTDSFLQKRYPRAGSFVCASNVLLTKHDPETLKKRLTKIVAMNRTNIKIITTAATHVKYKGQKYVIEAIPKLNNIGINVTYFIVGEGDQSYLKTICKKKHVENQVCFCGKPVRALFPTPQHILPQRQVRNRELRLPRLLLRDIPWQGSFLP